MKKELKQDLVTILGVTMVMVGIIGALYPMLYELGKTGIALLFGANITKVRVFPWMDFFVNLTNVGRVGQLFTSFGGIMLPVILCFVVRPSKLWASFSMLIMHLVSLIVVSDFIISVVCCQLNMPVINQDAYDAFRVMSSVPGAVFVCIFLLIGVCTCLWGSASEYEVMRILKDIYE